MSRAAQVVVAPLLLLIRFYQRWVSPALGPRCRFAPSCSHYAAEALAVHGPLRGGWLAVRRVARCHPWHPGGHDPVPPAVRAADPRPNPVAAAHLAAAPRAGART